MERGDIEPVRGAEDLYYYDTGMYDTDGYGAVYVYDTPEPAVVDTGIGANRDRLFDALSGVGIGREDLSLVLLTHAHLDHAGGAGFLVEACPNARVHVHDRAVRHLVDPGRLVEGTKAAVGDQWRYYADPEPVPEDRISGIADGDSLDLGDRSLTAVEAPGHAPHQVVFHEPNDGVVFTGDAGGIYVPQVDTVRPTTPPPQFDFDQCLDDLSTIRDLDPDLLCFPHFGPRRYDDDVIEGAKRSYVEWIEAVREKRAEIGDDEAVVERFAETAASDRGPYWTEERHRAEARLNTRGVLAYLDRVADE